MKTIHLAITSALLLLALNIGTASSAECKGSEKTSCSANNSCTWVDGYKRSDGKNVNGYCRMTKAQAKDKADEKKASAKDKMTSKTEAAKENGTAEKDAANANKEKATAKIDAQKS